MSPFLSYWPLGTVYDVNELDSDASELSTMLINTVTRSFVQRRAPRMSGYCLGFVIWLLEQPWASPIRDIFMRKSGVPQVTREMYIPDPTTFMPLWALPEGVPSSEVVLEGKVSDRLKTSAGCIPGTGPKTCWLSNPGMYGGSVIERQ